MTNLTYPELKAIMRKLGFVWFGNRAYDLNLIGIRSKNREAGKFDDVMYFAYKDSLGLSRAFELPITTDPLTYYLKYPMNPKGTAILKEGQWRGMWAPGLHKGKPALVQVRPVTVYRDINKDTHLDLDNLRTETGLFGINFHVGDGQTASAGCQVTPIDTDHKYCLELNKRQLQSIGTASVSYTLIREEWI